jgi:hypothetical protein
VAWDIGCSACSTGVEENPLSGLNQIAQIVECSAGDDRLRCQLRAIADRCIEHPLRNFARPATIVHSTAKDRDAATNHRDDNRDYASVPRVPAVKDFSLLGNVGVLLLGYTTTSDHTRRWQ